MRCLSLSALALALTSVVLADSTEANSSAGAASDVLTLTAQDFEAKVNPESLILVEFFAPWCGHCQALAPQYEQAATTLKEKNIKLAKVDCVDQADLCQANGVQGYPTLKVFRNGIPTDYGGPRKADGIVSYMIKQSLPAVSEVKGDNFEEFKKADKIVAIAYVSSASDAPAPAFSATAEKHRDDFLFGLSTDKDLIAAEGVTPPAIVVYRSFDAPKTVYPYPIADAQVSDIEEWVQDLSIPIIDEVNAENYGIYAQSSKPLAYLFLDPTAADKDEHIAKIKPVAEAFKSKMNFVWIDAIKFGDHAKALNLAEAKWPSFVVQDLEKQLKYPFDQSKDVTTDGARAWVEAYLAGELQPELKSEPIPEKQDEPVFVLVGKQFEEVVFDDSKDVFIEFYASWCGHCKRLKPTWDQLGERYADLKDKIVIAKMEAQENDLPPSVPFRISGFPTLKFKKARQSEFIDYEGDRTLESLIAFVEEHAGNNLEVPPPVVKGEAQAPLGAEEGHDEL
ncbi:protein disulfide isomerase [Moniliophthora roreri MCA 2997]|uniref:Protein disulfide-isomerase n=2 Tax=Moniliophthora roreri TaxID=221103 RepID=V2XQN3_MONRO|nr:protein disulfide isomerase [Moniliophthora roreri MCA 2997]KAI3612136.1 protein disulfide isomerase [Moniliophthora roreri]